MRSGPSSASTASHLVGLPASSGLAISLGVGVSATTLGSAIAVQRTAGSSQSITRLTKSHPPTPCEGFELLWRQGISIEGSRETLVIALEFGIAAKELPGE